MDIKILIGYLIFYSWFSFKTMAKHKKKKKTLKTNSILLGTPLGSPPIPITPQMIASKEPLLVSNNQNLITLDKELLSNLYAYCPITNRVINQPVEDALRGGIEIVSEKLGDKVKEITSYIEEHGVLDTVRHAFFWSRLYGGAVIIINPDNSESHEKLKIESISKSKELEFFELSRHEIELDEDNKEFYKVKFSDSELSIHKSRVIRLENRKAPKHFEGELKGWGLSECEKLKKALNIYNKSLSVIYELVDEAKIDFYKVGESDSLGQRSEERDEVFNILHRVNFYKNYNNAVVMGKDDDFVQKTINFSGLDSASNTAESAIVTASEMNRTKILGEQPSGFSSDTASLEDYNALVESSVRSPMKKVLRQIITLIMQKLFNKVHEFEINFSSLRILSDLEIEEIKTKKTSRLISLLSAGIIDQKEAKAIATRESLI